MACLFLLLQQAAAAQDPEWKFDATTQRAYEMVLNLQTDQVHQLIPQPQTAQEHYVTALAEALELLITGDVEKFNDYEDRFEQRLERKTKLNTPDDIFLQAEIRIQWAFIHFKFGHEFDAALNLRQAYLTVAEIKRRFPAFQAIKKTDALLEVIIGGVPEKYDWILSLLDIQGSTEAGINDLQSLRTAGHPLSLEADMLYALVQSYVLQQTADGMQTMEKILARHPTNRLALFLGASLAIKNSQGEAALELLKRLDHQPAGLPIYFADYLKGEVYLYKAEYLNSITSFRWFISHYKGQNNLKDSYYKIALCYFLNGNENDAHALFKQAKGIGKEITEADKYAARSLAEVEEPHIKLTKARYFTDGGYYDNARTTLESISVAETPTLRDQAELQYRKARLDHKTNRLTTAKVYYHKTIELNGSEEWYFAPNACLQLGYLAMAENDPAGARDYFIRALSYKKHEYKNSIDTKAKSAIAHLDRK